MAGSLALSPAVELQLSGFSATSTTTIRLPPSSEPKGVVVTPFVVVDKLYGTGQSTKAISPPGSNQSAPPVVLRTTFPPTLNLNIGSPNPAPAVAVSLKNNKGS